ncbi:nadh-ubiquinone/plastoquinone oxidoreductase chain 3 [Akkermansia glycaniphila]|uniref:NADH-quinone oxidoreductase subunit n=2 Tax=Akkermansia glycaniphila TaxID=1679444 RepID=A0A1C7PDS4_9BACT|nr:NADH-quinone oxidoreductase subunit A [Akkermansia glycaniphila]OCA03743.1 NADH-quinone oxidoreductase subunit I [Akkermansia glycaniphila]SEH76929.1 nadh-ubiquinone/plastoquinone oxidoreductase chain 3 [Akkermansia glycaniphila]
MSQEYFSALIQCIAAFGFAGMVLGLSVLFGRRAKVRKPANIPYECGMIPLGDGAPIFSVKFYLVAMLFVIFDLEVVFLYPWAINFKDFVMQNPEAFGSMCFFIGILLFAYAYAVGKGVVNWHHNPAPRKS